MKIKISENDKKDWNIKTKISCIYKITNVSNGKIYIGQTKDFRKRCSDYNNAHKKYSDNSSRYIYNVIKLQNSDNFVIEIEERCNKKVLNERERYYISLYDSTNPEKGYNILRGNTTEFNEEDYKILSEHMRNIHLGSKDTNNTKRKKSNVIIAIGNNKVIICDSGKLFGDFIGKSKDYIKNCLRQPSSVNGYYLYYDDYEKRSKIEEKLRQKKVTHNTNPNFLYHIEILNNCEMESVETIYYLFSDIFGTIYELKYENVDENGNLFLTEFHLPLFTEILEE